MSMLILGLIVFFGVHSASIVNVHWRDAMVARVGAVPWKAAYGLLSLVGLVLIVWGYAATREAPIVLYAPPAGLRHVGLLLLLFVFPLLLAAYFPGRIRSTLKHPFLVAIKVWALAHLLMNGMLGDVLLFGAFLVWAVADRISLKRRPPRELMLAAPAGGWNDAIAVGGGLAIYLAFVMGVHAWLIGVPVLR